MRGTPHGQRVRLHAIAALVVTAACSEPTPMPSSDASAAADVETVLYLIGDAGAPDPDGEPVFEALAADITASAGEAVIVFLGDNVYPRGIPPADAPGRKVAEQRLGAQIAIAVETGARGIFIPGNHDWDFSGERRRDRILRAAELARQWGQGRVAFLPDFGCPGPQTLDIGTRTRLIVLDTQWYLFESAREEVPAACATHTKQQLLESMGSALATAGDRNVVVAAHHPLATGGVHGGHFTFRQHIFPLTDAVRWAWLPFPLFGSLYPLARLLGVSDQDLSSAPYRAMIADFEGVLSRHPPLLYAAGHEHSLQVIEDDAPRYHVVSGAGNHGHTTPVRPRPGTLYAGEEAGYVKVEVRRDGTVRLGVIVVEGNAARHEVFATILRNADAQAR